MTKQNIWIVGLAAVMLVSATGMIAFKNHQEQKTGNDMLSVELHALQLNDGWGYEIMVDKKVFIHQDCIPAIASYKRFGSKSEAMLVGNKVVDKIMKGKKPAISLQEIQEAHIQY